MDERNRKFLELGTELKSRKHTYRITEQVGQGGTSLVYRGRVLEEHDAEGPFVIIKELKPVGAKVTEHLLEIEERAFGLARKLLTAKKQANDPHCWTYIDAFFENGTYYQVCYDVAGASLDVLLEFGGWKLRTLQDCVRCVLQILPAIAPLHASGYVHCDVKPENLFVAASNPPVFRCIDFGSAVENGSESIISSSRDYAPPEVLFSEEGPFLKQSFFQKAKVDVTFDTYALLAMLYRWITGMAPGERKGKTELKRADCELLNVSEEALRKLNLMFDLGLNSKRKLRYQSLEELQEDLQELLQLLDQTVYLDTCSLRTFLPRKTCEPQVLERLADAVETDAAVIWIDPADGKGANYLQAGLQIARYFEQKKRHVNLVPVVYRESLLKTIEVLPFGRQQTDKALIWTDYLDYLQRLEREYYILILGYEASNEDAVLLERLQGTGKCRFLLVGRRSVSHGSVERRKGLTVTLEMSFPVWAKLDETNPVLKALCVCGDLGLPTEVLQKLSGFDTRAYETLLEQQVICQIGKCSYINPTAEAAGEIDADLAEKILVLLFDEAESLAYYTAHRYEAFLQQDFQLAVKLLRQLPCKVSTMQLLSRLYERCAQKQLCQVELCDLYEFFFRRFREENPGVMCQLGDSLREFAQLLKGSAQREVVLGRYKNMLYEITERPEQMVWQKLQSRGFDEAIELASQLLELYAFYGGAFRDRLAELYFVRATAYFKKSKYELAIQDLTEALNQCRGNTKRYLHSRAVCYHKLGKLMPAMQDCEDLQELDPQWAEAYSLRAQIWMDFGQQEQALEDANHALALSDDAESWFYRGEIYRKLGRYEEALADYEQAIERNPSNATYRMARGSLSGWLGRNEQKAEDIQEAIRLEPWRFVSEEKLSKNVKAEE